MDMGSPLSDTIRSMSRLMSHNAAAVQLHLTQHGVLQLRQLNLHFNLMQMIVKC